MTQRSETGTRSIRHVAIRGAIWVTLISIFALPLSLYRNWILARLGQNGEVVGIYATILLFANIVITFVIFGGPTAVSNYLPKIDSKKDKAGFILSYWCISAITTALFLSVIFIWPGTLEYLMRNPLSGVTMLALASLTPLILFSQIATYSLAGLFAFRSAAVLGQSQLYFVVITATLGYLFAPQFFADHALIFLVCLVGLSHLVITLVGFVKIIRSVGVSLTPYLPKGFWRYSIFVHANTVSSFAYMNIDQLIILTQLGVRELGAYFTMLQFAQLIRFIPERIGQVLLASFSHLIKQDRHDQLVAGYKKLCRVIIILSTGTAVFLIMFSRPIGSIFGPWLAERHVYLICLAAAFNVGNIGSINSMLILSKERTGIYLASCFSLIATQLIISLTLVANFGVYAVILGKASGLLLAQVNMFVIVRWGLSKVRLSPPLEYWLSQALVLPLALTAWRMDGRHPFISSAIFLAAAVVFLTAIRFHPREFLNILKRR